MSHWYLIKFKLHNHRLAERNLHRQEFATFLLMQKTALRKASRFVSDLTPLFLGQMSVSVCTELALWRTIKDTIGVSRLVSFDGKLKQLPFQLVSSLMLRCEA